MTEELKELQEQKELEYQYLQIAGKLSSEQQAILQLHTGIPSTPQPYDTDLYPLRKGYSSTLTGSHLYSGSSGFHTSGNQYPGYQTSVGNRMDLRRSGYADYPADHSTNPATLTHSQNLRNFLQPELEGDGRNPRYSPPVKRFLLTKDPQDRRTAGNGLGMKVLGGKEIPGSKGRVCGFVSKILPSGVVDKLREVHEGDLVLEWNGVPLMDRTDSEVQSILDQTAQDHEVEILIRNDVNILTGKRLPDAHGKVPDFSTFRDQDWYYPGKDQYYREFPPRDHKLGYDINGNRNTPQNVVTYQPTSRDPFGQYSNLKPADPLDRQFGYEKGQLRDSFYNVNQTNKNYYHNSNYGSGWQRDSVFGPDTRYDYGNRDGRYGEDLRNSTSGYSQYRNHNNNKNSLSRMDPYQDHRLHGSRSRREVDRYWNGDRELPSTTNMIRRHSWDVHDESGHGKGQYWRSRNSCLDDEYYKRTEGDFLRARHHSDPAFRTDYQCVRRWHSTDRYPDEYRTVRHLPDIKLSLCPPEDPRERKYGSAQYLDHAARRYREEFDFARKDLDRFQRYGSFKDYGHHYHDDRQRDKFGSGYYSRGKSCSDDLRYAYDKYHDSTDAYFSADRYRDTRTNTERYRDEERQRLQQKQGLHRWKNQRDLYDPSRYQETLNPLYLDDRARDFRDSYDTRGRDGHDRYHDDGYYDYGNQTGYDPYRETTQSVYTSSQYRDDRAYQESRYRDARHSGYSDFETSERERKHRSRNPPQQLSLEGRAGPASPRRDEIRSRDRKHKNNSKEGKSRRSGKSRHHQSHQVQQAEVQLLICHDVVAQILYVTVLRARNLLTLREDGDTRPDPFIKVYLLPGRSLENQRRTRHFQRTSAPEWNQTMVYPNLHVSDLKKRYLEVTAWNYDQHRPNEFLGEVVLDLSDPTVVNEDPKWYTLQEMVDRADMPALTSGMRA
ncbi:uncharacterized protein LOC125178991 [Hyalella azteca]|uniref:Uncharacterized protein LOC125178991 n=1 Tax=Hyalella azteca TaxID=294128 RepID=A0A979FV72_HYAAZ|nr:uncharacterized protein LOC125178991 [Hyalella azteca]